METKTFVENGKWFGKQYTSFKWFECNKRRSIEGSKGFVHVEKEKREKESFLCFLKVFA